MKPIVNDSKLLAPVAPSNKGVKGMPPHHRYRLIRTKAEDIVRLRDDLKWSNNRAACFLGFRSPAEFDQAYLLLKANAEKLVMEGDWTGVERVIYQRFDNYEGDQKFRNMLIELGDPRMAPGGRLVDAPAEPMRLPPLPLAQVPPPEHAPTVPSPAPHPLEEPAVPVEPPTVIVRRFGKPTVRDPIVVAEEANAAKHNS